MVKNVSNIEKKAAKSRSHGGKVAEALYKDKKGPQMEKNVAERPPHGKKCSQYNHYTEKNVAKRPSHGKKVPNIVII